MLHERGNNSFIAEDDNPNIERVVHEWSDQSIDGQYLSYPGSLLQY